MARVEFRVIGKIASPIKEAVDSDWGDVVSTIRLFPEFAEGLRGLESFSHAVVLFLMHGAAFEPSKHLVRRPRDQEDMPLLGIFAQRARHRPNPIGVSTVRIEAVGKDSLTVRGLDAIDGTPVLDIKPHIAVFDSPAGGVEPEWVSRLMRGYF